MLVLGDSHGNRVELLGVLRGLDPKVFSRAVEVAFLSENLRIVGWEDFVAMKCRGLLCACAIIVIAIAEIH